jgi:hypothetical protein
MWPWLALAGLGAFHGLNPAMGWLFSVALGLQRGSRKVMWLALVPIALGHALSVILVVLAVVALGLIVDQHPLEVFSGLLLIGWAIFHAVYGHRHRVRVGMRTGMAGLGLWSFLMATSHGAGLMLVPVIIPLCLTAMPGQELTATGSLPVALAAIGVHTAAMLAVIAVIATVVYEWLGLAFLRKGWLNIDLLWITALVVTGLVLVV